MTAHLIATIFLFSVCLSCYARAAFGMTAAGGGPGLGLCGGRPESLREGRVVLIDREPSGGAGVALRACGLIDAPPGAVWPVVRNCGAYDLFLPGVSRSELDRHSDSVVLCDETVDLPFPLGALHSVTRVLESARPEGGFERRWTLIRGSYRRLNGSWTVLPWDESRERTLVIYELDMDPETVIPDFLLRRAQSTAAPEVFAALRRRVEQCTAPAADTTCLGE